MMFVVFCWWVGCISLGAYVSGEKGRNQAEGFLLGLFFGPLGVLVAALLPTLFVSATVPAVLPSPKTMAWITKSKPRPAPAPDPPPLPGRQRPHVIGDDGIVRWTCECGHYRTAPAATAGTRDTCPQCRTRAVVPGAIV